MAADSQGRLNMNIPSYQYRDSHYKDNRVLGPYYLYDGTPHTWKDRLYTVAGPGSLRCLSRVIGGHDIAYVG